MISSVYPWLEKEAMEREEKEMERKEQKKVKKNAGEMREKQ